MMGPFIPVADGVHVELGEQRVRADPWTSNPRLSTIVQVCGLGERDLAIVGVASGSRQLHSLTIEECAGVIGVGALVGDPIPRRLHDEECHVPIGQYLWVSEVRLDRPLGSRVVRDLFGDQRSGHATVYSDRAELAAPGMTDADFTP